MGNSSNGQPGNSGLSDLKSLLKQNKAQYEKLNPGDDRWPCPFCFSKCKNQIQCHIHVSKEHQTISRNEKKGFLSQFSNQYIETVAKKNKDQSNSQTEENVRKCRQKMSRKCKDSADAVDDFPNDLVEFLKVVEKEFTDFNKSAINYSNSQAEGYFYCHFCPEEKKRPFNKAKGLKIHISKYHPELKDDIIEIETNIDTEDNLL